MTFWVGLLIAVSFFLLGFIGGFLFACYGTAVNFARGDWVKREKTAAEYLFPKKKG